MRVFQLSPNLGLGLSLRFGTSYALVTVKMFLRPLFSQLLRPTTTRLACNRTNHLTYRRPLPVGTQNFHTSSVARDSSFTNLLADDNPPAVQVSSISEAGIQLADGLFLPGACVFLEGKVFLWDVPESTVASKIRDERWKGWGTERFQLFEVVTPRPGMMCLRYFVPRDC